MICVLLFEIFYYWNLKRHYLTTCCQKKPDKRLIKFAAVGTEFKILIQRPFAIRTGFILIAGLLRNIRAKFRDRLFTTITHDEWMTFFNSQDREKKETEVVIHPFKISLVQTANRAPPGVLVQYLCFGRYAGDEDHWKIWSPGVMEYWPIGNLARGWFLYQSRCISYWFGGHCPQNWPKRGSCPCEFYKSGEIQIFFNTPSLQYSITSLLDSIG